MIHTTFRKAKEANACVESYKKIAKTLGGVRNYGEDTTIPLSTILEVLGVQDTLWAFRCTIEPSADIAIEFTCRCAEHTLPNFESVYPDDKRPRQAIEAARRYLTDKSESARSAARSAWLAAESAAWSAAESAAESAARSAEKQWQIGQLMELMS